MNSKFKKIMAGCIIATMLPITNSMAAGTTDSFSEDFESVTTSTLNWTKSDWISWEPNVFQTLVEEGKFGKSNSDSALVVKTVPGGRAGKDYGVSKTIDLRDLKAGEKIHVSYEYLSSDFNGYKSAYITLKSDTGEVKEFTSLNYSKRWKDQQGASYFWQVEQKYDSWAIAMNKWYKFDYFIDPSDNSVDIYRDGTKLGSATIEFANGGKVSAMTGISFRNNQPTTTIGTHFAVDNINVEYVSSEVAPEISPSSSFIDFEMYKPNTGATERKPFYDYYDGCDKVSNLSANYTQSNGNEVVYYAMEDGIFGKSGKALHMHNNLGVSQGHAYVQTPEIAGLASGDKALISYEIAVDPNNTYAQTFAARLNTSKGSKGEYELVKLNVKNNALAICKQWVADLKGGRWYKIDLVIDNKTAKVTAFLNGRKVLDGVQPDSWGLASDEYITSVHTCRFQYYPNANNKGGVYYDNIILKNIKDTAPANLDATLTVNESVGDVAFDNVTVFEGTDVSTFLANSSANGGAIAVANSDGTVIDSGLVTAGSKILVTGAYGEPAVYDVFEKEALPVGPFAFTEDFEAVTTGTLDWRKTGRLVDDPNFTARVAGGEYGKANSDSALVVEEKAGGANKAFGIEKDISLRNMVSGEKLHVSFEYLVSDFAGWKGIGITLTSNNGGSRDFHPIFFSHRKNENISYFGYDGNWTGIAGYDYADGNTLLNHWYKYDFFIDPAGSVDIYRDGTFLGTKSFAFADGGTVKGITKFAVINSSNYYTSSGTHHAVDNINVEYVSSVKAPSAPNKCTFNDFEMLNANTNSANSKPFTDVYFWDAWPISLSAGNYVKDGALIYQMEQNVFGKSGQSLHMFDKTATSGHAFVQSREISLNSGDKALISYEIAIDPDNTCAQSFAARLNTSTGSKGEAEIVKLNVKNNALAICGTWVADLKGGRWYKIDLVIDSTTAKVTAYLNGRKVIDGVQPNSWGLASGEYITSINTCRFQYYVGANPGGVYYDNILFRNLGSGTLPEFDTTLTLDETIGTVKADTVTLIEGTDVSSFIANATANGAAISVVNPQGATIDSGAIIAGSKILVTGPYGEPAVYDVLEKVDETLIDEDFNTEFADGTIPEPFTQNKIGGQYTSITSAYQTGLGGKSDENGAYTFSVNNWNGDATGTNDPYIYYPIGKTVPYTLEASFLPGDDINFVVAVTDAANNELKLTLGNFSVGDSAVFMGSEKEYKVSDLHKNRWYKMAITLYPGTNYCDLWFNGELVAEKYVIPAFKDSAYNKIQYVRLHSWIDSGSAESPVSAKIALDDIKAYEGSYKGETSVVDFTTTLNCRKDTYKLFVDEAMEIGEFISAIETEGTVSIFEDDSMEAPISDDYVVAGNAVVITSVDEETYSYYKVFDMNDPITLTNNGQDAEGISRGTVCVQYDDGDEDAEGVLALAAYDLTGRLVNLVISEDYDGDGIYTCETEVGDNVGVKVMFWESMNNMIPLTEAKYFAPSVTNANTGTDVGTAEDELDENPDAEGPDASTLTLPVAEEESGTRLLQFVSDSSATRRLSGKVAVHDSSDAIFYSGEKHEMEAEPYYNGDVLMVSANDLADAYSKTYKYDSATGKIDFGTDVDMTIGSNNLVKGSTTKTMSAAPEVKNGVVMVPLQDVCEKGLNKTVTKFDRGLYVASILPVSIEEHRKIEVNNYMLYDRPKQAEIKSTMTSARPRVMLNPTSKESIVSAYQNKTNENIVRWGDEVLKTADGIINYKPVKYDLPDNYRLLAQARKFVGRSMNLSMAYLLTEDEKYSKRLWKELAAVGSFPDWNPQHYLDVSEITVGFAVAYDWLYDVWTEEERAFLEACIKNNNLILTDRAQYGVNPTYGGEWWIRQDNNWNAVCNSGAILGAAAIYETDSELCSRVIQNSVRGLESMLNNFYPLGAWDEGSTYWSYMMNYFAYLSDTLENCFETDFNLLSAPGLDNTAKFSVYTTGFTGIDNFHDAEKSSGTHTVYYWLAKKFDQPEIAKLRMQDSDGEGSLLDLLWFDAETVTGDFDLPLDICLTSDNLDYGSMRGSWSDTNSPYLSFHSGKALVEHGHLDLGTYVIDMLGERWAEDLGGDDYNLSGYFDDDVRYDYYRLRPEGHNVYVINPDSTPGQNTEAYTSIFNYNFATGSPFAISDLTQAYSKDASNAKRGYKLSDNRSSVIIRDEITLKNQSDVYWFSHTKADIQIVDNNTAILTKNGKSVKVSIITNGDITLSVMNAEPLATSPNPAGQASNSSYKKLCAKVSGSGDIYIQARWIPVDNANANTAQSNDALANW